MAIDIQKIKLLDSNVISRLRQQNLKEDDDTILACSTMTLHELIQSGPTRNISGLKNYTEYGVMPMLEWYQLFRYEYEKVFNKDSEAKLNFPFQEQKIIDLLINLVNSIFTKKADENIEKSKKIIELHNKDRQATWNSIKGGTNKKISIDEINEKEDVIINDIKGRNFLELPIEDVKRFTYYSKIITKLGKEEFKKSCHACYSEIRIQAFIDLMRNRGKKEKTRKNPESRLEFSFDNEVFHLDSNFFPDFKITAPNLAYIGLFVTHDRMLSILLKKIFPKYADKIQLLPQPA